MTIYVLGWSADGETRVRGVFLTESGAVAARRYLIESGGDRSFDLEIRARGAGEIETTYRLEEAGLIPPRFE